MPKGLHPACGDKGDLRCALIHNGCTDGVVSPSRWCDDCGFYVCEGCSTNNDLMIEHDVMDHALNEDES